jgi:hypothetical protein
MKKFKIIDFWVSVSLIIGSIIYGFLVKNETIIISYFIVGGWQVVSILIHFFTKYKANSSRKIYQLLALAIGLLPIAHFIDEKIELIILFVLLFVTPAMAIYYTSLCGFEVFHKKE